MTLWEMGAGSEHLLDGLQWPLQHVLGCTVLGMLGKPRRSFWFS